MITARLYEDTAIIHIHDDFCCNVKSQDIPQMLAQIGAIISNSYIRSATEPKDCKSSDE